jgi:hypothetical protein
VNPHFRSKYADLATCLKAIRPVLSKHGLALVQRTRIEGERMVLVTELRFKSEVVSGEWLLEPVKRDPQGWGSAMTYGRRYTAPAMVGVASDDDDDGNAASATPGRIAPAPIETPRPSEPSAFAELAEAIKACRNQAALDSVGAQVKKRNVKAGEADQLRSLFKMQQSKIAASVALDAAQQAPDAPEVSE